MGYTYDELLNKVTYEVKKNVENIYDESSWKVEYNKYSYINKFSSCLFSGSYNSGLMFIKEDKYIKNIPNSIIKHYGINKIEKYIHFKYDSIKKKNYYVYLYVPISYDKNGIFAKIIIQKMLKNLLSTYKWDITKYNNLIHKFSDTSNEFKIISENFDEIYKLIICFLEDDMKVPKGGRLKYNSEYIAWLHPDFKENLPVANIIN